MAINKVVFGNDTLIDITDTTATASDVQHGKYFYDASGVKIEGTAVGGGMIVVETEDEYGGTIVDISGEPVTLQTKSATPTAASQTILPDEGYTGLSKVNLAAVPTEEISIASNGSYYPTEGSFFNKVTVSVGSTINNQNKSVEPSESQQSVTADSGYTGLGAVTVGAISSNYVGSNIPARSSSDLTASGSAVTVPSGYYAAAATKNISAGSAATPATTISITPGVSINSSTGVVTATASGSQYVTPTVNAGYISAGTSGRITVSGSNTLSLTTQAAATITPTTSVQTAVASYRYTTGAVTVAAIPSQYKDITGVTATASDVVSGKTFVNSSGVSTTGSLVIQHYYTGSGAPAAASGSDGDIYLRTS